MAIPTPKPLLAAAAINAAARPESWVGRFIMPDTPTDDFVFEAPTYGNEVLEAADDDTIADRTDFKETFFTEGFYDVSIGAHGRKVVLGAIAIMKAERRRAVARLMGNTVSDPVWDLKVRAAALILAQIQRHNELLILLMATTAANYAGTHVLATLNVRTSTTVRETIMAASRLIEADSPAGLPANTVIFGAGATSGLEQNASILPLLPDNAPKIVTSAFLQDYVTLEAGGTFATANAMYKSTKKAAPIPMMNNFIWVGRTVPQQDAVNATFGRNYVMPHPKSGQDVYANEVTEGVSENVELGVQKLYRPLITEKAYGVLIPTTSA